MKYFKYILVSFLVICFPIICDAKVKTNVRTEKNLRVPKDVVVNDNNREAILKTPSVSEKDKVYDFEDLLSEKEKKDIYNKLKKYTSNTGIDAVVVVTSDLCGFTLSDYTFNFYDYNNFKDDGTIFVLYLKEDNKYEIYMGLSGGKNSIVYSIYTNKVIEQTLKYVFYHMKENKYYEGIVDYIAIIQKFYSLDSNANYKVDEHGNVILVFPWIESIILAFTSTVIIIILLISSVYKKDKKSLSYYDDKLDNETLMIRVDKDQVITDTKI